METFTDEVMRSLLRRSLDTAELRADGWHDVGRGLGSSEGDFIDWLTIKNQTSGSSSPALIGDRPTIHTVLAPKPRRSMQHEPAGAPASILRAIATSVGTGSSLASSTSRLNRSHGKCFPGSVRREGSSIA
jgi:hypothetical protein